MAKEETIQNEERKPLDAKQLAAYVSQLETRLKSAYSDLREAKKELSFYQMQDYYQRAQLLCVLVSNTSLNEEFRKKCEEELMNLVYPPQPEGKEETPKE